MLRKLKTMKRNLRQFRKVETIDKIMLRLR